MRIVAGQFKGRKLHTPRGSQTRPTSDRVKEALFNILGPPACDTLVLDLFAGSGNLGLEALSRGARHAVFVDNHRAARAATARNIGDLGLEDRCQLWLGDVLKLVPKLDAKPEPGFGWIFLDPPYATDLAEQTLALLAKGVRVTERTCIAVEHDRRLTLPLDLTNLTRTDQRSWGDTSISMYRRPPAPSL